MRRLLSDDVSLIATIDRSEHVEVQYGVIDGRLIEQPVAMPEIPTWDATGTGPHSVAAQIEFCASLIADGAVLLGAVDDEQPVGLAVIDASFEPRVAWLALLYVSRPHRRRGAAQALWDAAVEVALAAGAESIYVSLCPHNLQSGSTSDRAVD